MATDSALTDPVPSWLRKARQRAPQGVIVARRGAVPSVGGVALQPAGGGRWVVATDAVVSEPLAWPAACTLARDARGAGCRPFVVVAPGAAPQRCEKWLQQGYAAAVNASAKRDGGSFWRVVAKLTTAPPTGPMAVAPTLASLVGLLVPGATVAPVVAPDVVAAVSAAVVCHRAGDGSVPTVVRAVLDDAARRVGRPFVPAATAWPSTPLTVPKLSTGTKRPRLAVDPRAVAEAILAAAGPPLFADDVVAVEVPPAQWPNVVAAATKTLLAKTRTAPRDGVFVLWGGRVLCNGVDGVGALLATVAADALYRLKDDAQAIVPPESAAAKLPLAPPRRRASTTSGSKSPVAMAAAEAAITALGMDAMGLSAKQLRETTEYLAWMIHKDVPAKPGPPCLSDDRQRGRGCLRCAGVDACRAATQSDAMDEPGATPCHVVAATLTRPPCLTVAEAKRDQRAQLASAALTAHKVIKYTDDAAANSYPNPNP